MCQVVQVPVPLTLPPPVKNALHPAEKSSVWFLSRSQSFFRFSLSSFRFFFPLHFFILSLQIAASRAVNEGDANSSQRFFKFVACLRLSP